MSRTFSQGLMFTLFTVKFKTKFRMGENYPLSVYICFTTVSIN